MSHETERVSYCTEFEKGTGVIKILKLKKKSLYSEQIFVEFSEQRELESKITRENRKELALSKQKKGMTYRCSHCLLKNVKNLLIWDTGKISFA